MQIKYILWILVFGAITTSIVGLILDYKWL
jgi:hypothetical protein